MAAVGQKLDMRQFEIASGVVMSVAVLLACGRVYIKASKFHRLFVDDFLLIFATVLLVAGTVVVFLTLPYNQTEVNVGAGLIPPPADLGHQLDYDVKFQDAATLLLNGSVFSVKFSFLFFFRLLLHRTDKLRIWWWTVFIITIPCAIICMCTEFMVCPAFGDRIYPVCVTSGLTRQKDVLYTVVALDIATDVLLISIPILLLWNVKINLRRKLALGSLLCLSIFAIITNIIRVVGHNLTNGQDDVVWILFWGEMEACVAVMANSGTAFRSLFARSSSAQRLSPQQEDVSPVLRAGQRTPGPQVGLQTLPTAALSGLRSLMLKDPFEDEEGTGSEEGFPSSGSRTAHSLEACSKQPARSTNRDMYEKGRPSHEGFV